jgi:uncharacterized membrane protein YcaP (DUF421 family)
LPEWIETILRSFFVVIILFTISKLLGKKKIGELGLFEFLSGIAIAGISTVVILGNEMFLKGAISIFIIFIVLLLIDVIAIKSKSFHDFVKGTSTTFIKDGKVLEDNLKKERYTADELFSALRQKNIFNIADVEYAQLEASGDLSVLPKKESIPVTPKDMKIPTANAKEPYTVIMDGQILDEDLGKTGKTRQWLNVELEKLGVLLENVYIGQVDSYGELTVDVYDDTLNIASPQERPLLMAMLKKSQADLELYSLSTDCDKAKEMYKRNGEKMKNLVKKLEPFLR